MATQTTANAIRLLNDNDPNAIHPDNPEAAANIMALARLAAYKAFCEVGVWHENRQRHYEDAVQEAAASIWQYADRGLRRAYVIAKKRNINWVIRYVWQGKPQTAYEKRNGYQTLLPIGPSLDACPTQLTKYDWDWLASESPTPEELLVGEEISEREASIEAFYDIVVDIVSKQMGLTRRQYYTAHKDAKALVCVLHSKNTKALMAEFDCSSRYAYARLRQARERLCAFITEKGEDTVAQMYKGPKTWCDARARLAFITDYVAEQRAVYETKREKSPPDSATSRWRRKGRAVWNELEEVVVG